jgi:phage-related protein
MPKMQAVYYRERTGREPVREFVRAQDAAGREAVAWGVELLNGMGVSDPPLPFPYSSQVVGDLRELRCHAGRRHIRVLYRRSERLFVLLHAFEKRSVRVAASDVAIAEDRWADFRARMDEMPRSRLRAAGADAP